MCRFSVVVLAVAITATTPVSPRAQSPLLKVVMQEKAQNAQALLKPLVLGDFAGIERYASRLGRLTYTEVASWQANPNSEYQKQATAFLRAIEDLGQAAEARDVKRASTAYGSLVSSCVNCHQLVKARQSASLAPSEPFLERPLLSGSRSRSR